MTKDPPQESPFELQEAGELGIECTPPGTDGNPPSGADASDDAPPAAVAVAPAKPLLPTTDPMALDQDEAERQEEKVDDQEAKDTGKRDGDEGQEGTRQTAEAVAEEDEQDGEGDGEGDGDGEVEPSSPGAEAMELEPTSGAEVEASAGMETSFGTVGKDGKESVDTEEGRGGQLDGSANDCGQLQTRRSGSAPAAQRPRKPHLQGRFSGRLETKHDEKKLQEECRQLGPLVGGLGKRGEKSRMTLAKIVRAIASGDVRKHCVERENKIQELQEKLKTMETVYRREMELLKQEIISLRMKAELRADEDKHHQVIITPATVPPMVVVQGGTTRGRYPASDPGASIAGGLSSLDVSSLPFVFPSQSQGIQGTNPIARTRVAHVTPADAERAAAVVSMQGNLTAEGLQGQRKATLIQADESLQAHARALAQVRSQVGAAQNVAMKRKLEEMQASGGRDLVGDAKPEDTLSHPAIVSEHSLAKLAVTSAAKGMTEREDATKAFQRHADQKAHQILKVVPAQVLPMSQNLQAGVGGSPKNIAPPQQQVTLLSVPGPGLGENEGGAGLASAMGLVGGHAALAGHAGQELRAPTVALTLGDDVASHHLTQQAGLAGQKAVILSSLQANTTMAQGGSLSSHFLSGQLGTDNVVGHLPSVGALANTTTQAPIRGQGISQISPLEESALSTPMETEVMDPSVLEQLNTGDLDLATVAAAVPILHGAGAGAQIVMPVQMTSEAGRSVG